LKKTRSNTRVKTQEVEAGDRIVITRDPRGYGRLQERQKEIGC